MCQVKCESVRYCSEDVLRASIFTSIIHLREGRIGHIFERNRIFFPSQANSDVSGVDFAEMQKKMFKRFLMLLQNLAFSLVSIVFFSYCGFLHV